MLKHLSQDEEYLNSSADNQEDPETMTESSSPVSSPHDESVSSQSHSTTCHSPPPPFPQQTLYISRPPSQLSTAQTPSPQNHTPDDHEDDISQSSPNPSEIVQIKMEDDEEEVVPRLRLNVGLASDPALQPHAKDIKRLSDESLTNENDERSSDTSSPFPSITPSSVLLSELTRRGEVVKTPVPPIIVAPGEPIVRTAGFICDPCGIKFSSLSTLEAHQTYYCSHNRKEVGESGPPIVPKPGSSAEPATSSPISEHQLSNNSNINNRPPLVRTGRQYACTHCSYSADKKVSLNRHMRMHQSSPANSSLLIPSNGDGSAIVDQAMAPSQMQLADRYCSDCDIPFSSTKTYRAHKQHYCSGRQRDGPNASSSQAPAKAPTPKSRSQSPNDVNKSPPVPVAAPQPFLALPTNPIIIIPYSLIRAASILPGPLSSLSPNLSNPDHTCFMLKDQSLQPIAHALNMPIAVDSRHPSVGRVKTPSVIPSAQCDSVLPTLNSVDGSSKSIATPISLKRDQLNRSTTTTTTTPLDLSVQRSALGGFPRARRIRSESASSSFSDEPDSDLVHMKIHLEGKENVSQDSNSSTPENIVCAPSLPGSPGQSQSPKNHSQHSPRGVLVSSPNPLQSSAHFAAQSMMLRQLLPAELAARLADPAAIERHNIELALRLSAAASMPETAVSAPKHATSGKLSSSSSLALGHPQIFVKQGASKCRECNIVFCKYENYIAHKKHYCSARITDEQEVGVTKETSPPTSPKVASTSSLGSNVTKPAPTLAYQQLICAACGIKFTSLDNLSAHQMYYCPKRTEQNAPNKEKCSKCKTVHEQNVSCVGSSTMQFPSHNPVVYKCPMCDVVSQNAAESRRHLETHSSIKAFRCSICRYRGNTLRGMRTHIRMHFDKKSGELNEEHYISCILEDDGSEAAQPVKVSTTANPSDQHQASLNPVGVIANKDSYSITIKTEPMDVASQSPLSLDEVIVIPNDSPTEQPPSKRIKLEQMASDDISSIVTPLLQLPPATPALCTKNNEPKYCSICDIKFTYLNTYLAHKQYYCKEAAAAKAANIETTPVAQLVLSESPKPTVAPLL